MVVASTSTLVPGTVSICSAIFVRALDFGPFRRVLPWHNFVCFCSRGTGIYQFLQKSIGTFLVSRHPFGLVEIIPSYKGVVEHQKGDVGHKGGRVTRRVKNYGLFGVGGGRFPDHTPVYFQKIGGGGRF